MQNNTGYGIHNPASWMCIYHITSPVGTSASIKNETLDIIGLYKVMYISAGVAIHNVANQNRSLVAHWHETINGTGRYLGITSIVDEIYMTVFAYSPIVLLY